MGFPGAPDKREQRRNRKGIYVDDKPWKPARWGDAALGKHNGGVNGEEGLGGGWERGYNVVELGAG
jgi:hypothetical protein